MGKPGRSLGVSFIEATRGRHSPLSLARAKSTRRDASSCCLCIAFPISLCFVYRVDPVDAIQFSFMKKMAVEYFPSDMFFMLRVVQLLRDLAHMGVSFLFHAVAQ